MFDAKKVKNDIVDWIRKEMKQNGGEKVVIGISGGKDSSVVAALCVEALGKENVIGVLMPQGNQKDISYSYEICKILGIKYYEINIEEMVNTETKIIENAIGQSISNQARTNLPSRIRTTVLYAVAQSIGKCRVTCNSNLSEDFIGFATKYGDTAGDLGPIQDLTVQEVKLVGKELGIPSKLTDKTPIDGLCGMTDEENFGFTYEVLDRYIREGICEDLKIKSKIDSLNEYNKHKLEIVPKFRIK